LPPSKADQRCEHDVRGHSRAIGGDRNVPHAFLQPVTRAVCAKDQGPAFSTTTGRRRRRRGDHRAHPERRSQFAAERHRADGPPLISPIAASSPSRSASPFRYAVRWGRPALPRSAGFARLAPAGDLRPPQAKPNVTVRHHALRRSFSSDSRLCALPRLAISDTAANVTPCADMLRNAQPLPGRQSSRRHPECWTDLPEASRLATSRGNIVINIRGNRHVRVFRPAVTAARS